MDFSEVKSGKHLLLECISGSKAYGLSTPQSDEDRKGVFILPQKVYYGLTYTEQVSDRKNDEVYYELRRYIDLLVKNNPNILELLSTPADCIVYKHPIMDRLKPEMFLSKQCKQAFAGYAQTQIKKAYGLNKKILTPIEKEHKTVIDFCYVPYRQGAISLDRWLAEKGFRQEDCGLVSIDHMRNTYALFHDSQLSNGSLKGVYSGPGAHDVLLSSVEKGVDPLTIMSFNKDGYSAYCRTYKEYWDWVGERNESRYNNTLEHGKNYDAKNMMHTFRLLNMAEEIAKEGKINVRRGDCEFLLAIRRGVYSYDELVLMANEKISHIDSFYESCSLPDYPDLQQAEDILVAMREELYGLC